MQEIIVSANFGLNDMEISDVTKLEKRLDAAMVVCGMTRISSGKAGDKLQFKYIRTAKTKTLMQIFEEIEQSNQRRSK